jgi:hypothetical protein
MPTTIILVKVVTRPDNSIYVEYSDGQGAVYNSLEDMAIAVTSIDDNSDFTKNLLLAFLLRRSPNLSNLSSVLNRQFTFDLSANNPIRIT